MEDSKKFLGGLHLSTFLSTTAEWHAFLVGSADGFTFTKTDLTEIEELKGEKHYYKTGIFFGRLIFIVAITTALEVIL